MRWPWVPRARYEEAERGMVILRGLMDAHYQRGGDNLIRVKAAEDRATAAESRYDALLERYHALKLSGAEPVPPPVAAGSIAPPAPDELRELIGEVCGTDYAKRKIMLRQLAIDRAAKIEDDTIRRHILQGVSADGVPT